MSEEQEVRARAKAMTDRELIVWLYIFEHMRGIESLVFAEIARLLSPEPDLATIQEILRAELLSRRLGSGTDGV